jgi:hypothetical protein
MTIGEITATIGVDSSGLEAGKQAWDKYQEKVIAGTTAIANVQKKSITTSNDAMNTQKGIIEKLQEKLISLKEGKVWAGQEKDIARYNQLIQKTESELRRLGSVGVEAHERITIAAKGNHSALENINRRMEQFARGAGGLLVVGAAIELGKKAWEGYASVMESTRGSSVKFEEQTQAIKDVFDELKQSLATLNFSDFASRLEQAAVYGEEFARQMERVYNVTQRNQLITSELSLSMSDLMLKIRAEQSSRDPEIMKQTVRDWDQYFKLNQQLTDEFLKQAEARKQAAMYNTDIRSAFPDIVSKDVDKQKFTEDELKWYAKNVQAITDLQEKKKELATWAMGSSEREKKANEEMESSIMAIATSTGTSDVMIRQYYDDYSKWMGMAGPAQKELISSWQNLNTVIQEGQQRVTRPTAMRGAAEERLDKQRNKDLEDFNYLLTIKNATVKSIIPNIENADNLSQKWIIGGTNNLKDQLAPMRELTVATEAQVKAEKDAYNTSSDTMEAQAEFQRRLQNTISDIFAVSDSFHSLSVLIGEDTGGILDSLGQVTNGFGNMAVAGSQIASGNYFAAAASGLAGMVDIVQGIDKMISVDMEAPWEGIQKQVEDTNTRLEYQLKLALALAKTEEERSNANKINLEGKKKELVDYEASIIATGDVSNKSGVRTFLNARTYGAVDSGSTASGVSTAMGMSKSQAEMFKSLGIGSEAKNVGKTWYSAFTEKDIQPMIDAYNAGMVWDEQIQEQIKKLIDLRTGVATDTAEADKKLQDSLKNTITLGLETQLLNTEDNSEAQLTVQKQLIDNQLKNDIDAATKDIAIESERTAKIINLEANANAEKTQLDKEYLETKKQLTAEAYEGWANYDLTQRKTTLALTKKGTLEELKAKQELLAYETYYSDEKLKREIENEAYLNAALANSRVEYLEKSAELDKAYYEQQQEEQQKLQSLWDSITGGGNSFTDAIKEGLKNGTPFVETFGNNFKDILRNSIINGMATKLIEPEINALLANIGAMLADGELSSGDESRIQYMSDVAQSSLEKKTGLINQALEAAGVGASSTTATTTGLQGAIKGMSEETAGLIAGQFNGLRVSAINIERNTLPIGEIRDLLKAGLGVTNKDSLRAQGW